MRVNRLPDKLAEASHQDGHPLGSCNDLVVLAGPLPNLLVQAVSRYLQATQKWVLEWRTQKLSIPFGEAT